MNTGSSTTKTWSDAQQVSSLRADNKNREGAGQFEEAFGDQNLGEVLNKISDPNWVDPSKTRRVGNPSLDKDAFLKLMLHQLQNQDPTNPLKSHEMAAQLAQFSSLEQMSNMNETLGKISEQQGAAGQFDVLQFIGKNVAGDASKFTRISGEKSHEFTFNLPASAERAKIQVKDAEGTVVKEYNLPGLKQGENSIVWNGVTDEGLEARSGEYRFEVEAVAPGNRPLAVATDFSGPVTGVKFLRGQPVLMVGHKNVKMNDIQMIEMPKLAQEASRNNVTPQDQVREAQGKEVEIEDMNNNLGDVGMSSGLMNQIGRELSGGQ